MNDTFWRTTLWTILIALLIGGGAGILATSYTSSYLSDYALELSKLTAPLRLAQSEPKQFPASLEEAMHRFSMNTVPSLVSLYPATTTQSYGYRQEDVVSTGLILTSDGWVLIPKESITKGENLVVAIGDQLYPIQKMVDDTQAGLVYAKVQADGLNIVGFGTGMRVTSGEQVLVASNEGMTQLQSILSVAEPQGVAISSDTVFQTFTLTNPPPSPAYVFSLSGDLLGVTMNVREQAVVFPAQAFLPAFRTLLEKETLSRPSLGVSTVSLAHSIGLSEKTRRSKTTGALIVDRKAIVPGSAAEKAGLKPLDLLLSYNGQSVNREHTLDQYVSESKPGEEITLHLDRAGEEMDVKVTLGGF